ncbi:3-dehydroquinate synthase [Flavobacterium capsici]|uniref:3-dehydroquinate synthase n=1 Tax=Flavobacterium capsici TaxID=3075618 RepID=A0AA96J1X9_9FLAO|nr:MULTISPECIES: 3-dehydroquinate synthase [unclassified Flavobacterium]WNM18390.1 3-dehydroquinate synthase [Flavobacterium sp. PMR2A8]WNM22441.1 3-dehydroquinate synthase [Flavobacterium sp. PMTSA4]
MQSIKANDYSIHFLQNSYQYLNEQIEKVNYSTIFILVDSNTNEYCLPYFLPYLETTKPIEIIEIEAGEEQKNIETCVEIWKILTELGGDRKSLIINLGGGVITDIGGFVASTFKRGIDFINIPTSLLAMVDASVGGKNGVDLGSLKNQIGVINVPKMVLIDTEYLANLPQNEMRSGLAEMLKHGLIYDKNYWEKFIDLSKIDLADLDQLIHRSVEIKNEIVSQDLTENGIRKSLNFGHTLGHAIESYFLENPEKKTLLHGEAIAVGMILESYISYRKNLISETDLEHIKKTLLNYFEKVNFEEKDIQPILDLLIHDKKNEYGKVQFCLLNSIGKTIYNQEADNELINKAFQYYNT